MEELRDREAEVREAAAKATEAERVERVPKNRARVGFREEKARIKRVRMDRIACSMLITCSILPGLFTGRVKPRGSSQVGSGRVGQALPDLIVKILKKHQTRPDPTQRDPTRGVSRNS